MAKPTQECPELRKPCLQTHRYEPGEFCTVVFRNRELFYQNYIANMVTKHKSRLALRICATDHPIVALVNISAPPPNLLVTSEADTPEVGSHGKSTLPTSNRRFSCIFVLFFVSLFSRYMCVACLYEPKSCLFFIELSNFL